MLCAGVKNTRLSGCHGDSGGPYVCLNADQKTYTLHGAVSWGSPTCNSSQLYTVFARVTQFLPWIKQHKEHGDGGGGLSSQIGPHGLFFISAYTILLIFVLLLPCLAQHF